MQMRKYLGAVVGTLAVANSAMAQATANIADRATSIMPTIVTQGPSNLDNRSGPGQPNNSRYNATYNKFNGVNGIVYLIMRTPIGSFACTGTLINNVQILTAAHCITNGSAAVIATSVEVYFQGPSNTFEARIDVANPMGAPTPGNMQVMPGYTGVVIDNRDLAVLTLPSIAPAFASRVPLFTGTNADIIGQQVTFAGYGSTGTGDTGDIQPGYGLQRRFGYNRFEATCSTGGSCTSAADRSILIADFDNGSPTGGYDGDAMCAFFGNPSNPALRSQLCNKGVTNDILDEVGIGRGDSGGSALFNGMIVGVASWGARLDGTFAFGGWGTLNGHVSVMQADNRAWLNTVTGVPEPSTYALFATGIVMLGAYSRRRNKKSVG
jgi:Trypsin/PEP-CTERM motif